MVNLVIQKTGQYIDVEGDISLTLQASDIGELAKAKSSYSFSFKIPRTENNTSTFELLGCIGSVSTSPYKKIKITVLNDGFTVLSDANLQITGANKDYYKAHITHGIVDFFQAINNKFIGDLDLQPLNHENTRSNIISTWQQDKPYKYGIASFNGSFNQDMPDGYTNFKNTSLLPSANCEWLMQAIFWQHGWTYEGLDSLKKLWMTYPQAASENESGVKTGVFEITDSDSDPNYFVNLYGSNQLKFDNTIGIDNNYVENHTTYIEAKQDMVFALKVPHFTVGVPGMVAKTHYYVNGVPRAVEFLTEFSAYSIGEVNTGDKITLALTFFGQGSPVQQATLHADGYLSTFAPNAVKINWNEALIELKIKDFIKEMMMQKSVVAIADATNQHIKFLSVDDRLNADIVDLSNIFVSKESEKYTFGNYAQNNYFRHKYDNDEQDFADGNIIVNNENLTIEQDMYQSIGYAPLRNTQEVVINQPEGGNVHNPTQIELPILKMYDIEVSEDGNNIQVNYKPLDKRFYFHTVEKNPYTSIFINGQSVTAWERSFPVYWVDIVESEYAQIKNIIDQSKIFTVKIAVNRIQANNFRLDKRYYIEQLASTFLVNKLTYKSRSASTVELIKIR